MGRGLLARHAVLHRPLRFSFVNGAYAMHSERLFIVRTQHTWCIFCIHSLVLQTHGPSMMPTLNEMGDVVLVDKLSPRLWNPIQRNDVVVADSSYKADFSVCKRVVGLPGDVVIPAGSWHGIVVSALPPSLPLLTVQTAA